MDEDILSVIRADCSRNARNLSTSDDLARNGRGKPTGGRPGRLDWRDECERVLAEHRGTLIGLTILELHIQAAQGDKDARAVVLDRYFGKVSTPIELDTSGLSTDQKIAALGALTGAEEAGSGPAQG